MPPKSLLLRWTWLSADALLCVLALMTVDSIYYEPRALRMGTVAASAVGIAWMAKYAGDRRKWVIYRMIWAVLLAGYLGTATAVRPGFLAQEIRRIILPWRERRSPRDIATQKLEDLREESQKKLLQSDQPRGK